MAENTVKKITNIVMVTPSMTGSTVDTQIRILCKLLDSPQSQTGNLGKYSQMER